MTSQHNLNAHVASRQIPADLPLRRIGILPPTRNFSCHQWSPELPPAHFVIHHRYKETNGRVSGPWEGTRYSQVSK